MKVRNAYAVLGCTAASGDEALRLAYRRLCREHHPDKGGDPAQFAHVVEAYGQVKDATARARYANVLALHGVMCKRCHGSGVLRRTKSFTQVIETPCADCEGRGWRI
jgi:DnaJ-class molecular chaperone